MRRHHRDERGLQKAICQAAQPAGIPKPVTPHTFRHSFAPRLLEDGYDIRTVQELLGRKNVRTAMIYAHVLRRGGLAVRSPLDEATTAWTERTNSGISSPRLFPTRRVGPTAEAAHAAIRAR